MHLADVPMATDVDYANAFFEEAVRDLWDASTLHGAGRYPGAVTSAMHAAEKAIKALLFLQVGWPNFRLSHRPFDQEIRPRMTLFTLFDIDTLANDIDSLEAMVPQRNLMLPGARNPEYPYFDRNLVLERPEISYSQRESAHHFNAAKRVIEIVINSCPLLAALQKLLPSGFVPVSRRRR